MTEASERLANWLRTIDLAPGASRQQAIEKAALALFGDSNGRAILDLTLVAHGVSTPVADSQISSALRAHDETWDVRPGDLEAALTSAAAAALGMEKDPAAAVPFSLAILGAEFNQLRPSIAELPNLARSSLIRASESFRSRSPLKAGTPDLGKVFTDVREITEGEQVLAGDLKAVMKGASAAASRVAAVTTKLLPALNQRLEAADEELDVLWWVFGEYSELAQKPFEKVTEGAIGFVSGIELNSFVKRDCPLPSTRAILSRVLRGMSEQEINLSTAIPATMKLVGEDWIPDAEGHPLLPTVSSAKEYVSLAGKAAWKESVTRWNIDVKRTTSSLELAEQVNRELLLVSLTGSDPAS